MLTKAPGAAQAQDILLLCQYHGQSGKFAGNQKSKAAAKPSKNHLLELVSTNNNIGMTLPKLSCVEALLHSSLRLSKLVAPGLEHSLGLLKLLIGVSGSIGPVMNCWKAILFTE